MPGLPSDILNVRVTPVDAVPIVVLEALTVDTAAAATECSDGIDNDGDGRIDLDDKQCKSSEQLSESDPKV